VNPQLRADILARLTGPDYQGVVKGQYVQRIACPDCHKREAYTRTENPWMIYCGRMDKCGAAIHVKDQFAEYFDDWSARYAPVNGAEPAPNAVADGYLRDGRGFDLRHCRGHYTQEYHHDQRLDIGSPTVRFTLPGGATWERIIDAPWRFGKKKAVFRGDYKGDGWQLASDAELVAAGEVWLVEGIFDCIALAHHGIGGVSAMSCVNFPALVLERLKSAAHAAQAERPTLVWALDANRAGRDWAKKHARRAEELGWTCRAAQPPHGLDWNDLHQRGELGEDARKIYRYYGDLLMAPSPAAKARLMHERSERRAFLFGYDNRMYWFELDQAAMEKAVKAITGEAGMDAQVLSSAERRAAIEQAAKVVQVCSAYPTALYYQANEITDESWYYFRVDSPGGASVQNTFSGGQLSANAEFKKRLLSIAAGAVWTGTAQQLDRLLQEQLARIKTVETIDYVGYTKEHGAWLLGEVAVARGRLLRQTKEDYFNLGRLRLKSLARTPALDINPRLDQFQTDWLAHLIGAWGADGIVTLAFWLGSLFAEQIRAEFESYPFLELVGEPGTGKSTLLEFLWKLCGRMDYEGFDANKSTMAGRARNFAQVANLPVVLIESDRESEGGAKQRQFDWDELKSMFNGRAVRSRGVRTAGNETYEPPFRGSIVISQNAEVQAGQAIQSRLVHIKVDKSRQSRQTKEHAEAMAQYGCADVSGFILKAAMQEKAVLGLLRERYQSYANYIMAQDAIREFRIGRNHAQMLALVDALGPEGLQLINEEHVAMAQKRLLAMAIERQRALNADHPVIEEFWEAYEYLESLNETEPVANHYGKDRADGQIAVNLKHFEALCAHNRIEAPPAKVLKRYLKASRSRNFIQANQPIWSQISTRSIRCWIFEDRRGQ